MREETIRRLNTGELISNLVNNISAIFDREISLAKAEARADVRQAISGGAALAIGLLFVYTAVPALVTAAILALWPTLSPPMVALIVAALFAVIGAIVAYIGWNRVRIQPLERTRETLKEDVEWARNQTTSPRR